MTYSVGSKAFLYVGAYASKGKQRVVLEAKQFFYIGAYASRAKVLKCESYAIVA